MDKEQALHQFWNSFNIPAYDENTIPKDATLPYIAYEVAVGSFEHEIPLTASIYYRSNLWSEVTSKSHEIARKLHDLRGCAVQIDGGRMRIYEGETPLFQRMADEDNSIRRIVVNVMAEFMAEY